MLAKRLFFLALLGLCFAKDPAPAETGCTDCATNTSGPCKSTSNNTCYEFMKSEKEGEEVCPAETEECGGEEGMSNREQYTAVYVFGTIIVLISISFDLFREWLDEKLSEHMKPVLDTLFEEMTLLGFMGLIFFVVSQAKIWDQFGAEHEELSELFENVHMIIFLVMVVYLFVALCLIVLGEHVSRNWAKMEAQVTVVPMEGLIKAHVEYCGNETCWDQIKQSWFFQTPYTLKLIRYATLRYHFIRPNELKHGGESKIDPNFNFSLYLSHRQGERMSDLVKVPAFMWVVIELVFTLIYVLLYALDFGDTLTFWLIGVSYLLPPCLLIVQMKQRHILTKLLPPYFLEKAKNIEHNVIHAKAQAKNDPDLAKALLRAEEHHLQDELSKMREYESCRQVHIYVDPTKAPYLEEDDQPTYRQYCGRRYLITKHQDLFWFGHHGPQFNLRYIQLIYLVCTFLLTVNAVMIGKQTQLDADVIIGLYVLMALPLLILCWLIPHSIIKLVMITSIEQMKCRKGIAKVEMEMKARRTMKVLQLVAALAAGIEEEEEALDPEKAAKLPKNAREAWTDPAEYERRRKVVKRSFDLCDKTGAGAIHKDDLKDLLTSLGMTFVNDGDLNRIMSKLDASGDGEVDFEEFFDWISVKEYKRRHQPMNAEELVETLFRIMDKDNSGSITVDEFQETILSLGEKMTAEEIKWLIDEADKDGDGEIDVEELKELTIKYL